MCDVRHVCCVSHLSNKTVKVFPPFSLKKHVDLRPCWKNSANYEITCKKNMLYRYSMSQTHIKL